MKNWTPFIIAIIILAGSNYVTYWQTGEKKEREFVQRLKDAPARIDTFTIYKDRIIEPKHAEVKARPLRDSARADSIYRDSTRTMREKIGFLSARIDTTIQFDSTATLRLQVDPVTRMIIADLQLAPVRDVERDIVKTVYVPIVEHDSFWTRAAYVGSGVIITGVVYALTK